MAKLTTKQPLSAQFRQFRQTFLLNLASFIYHFVQVDSSLPSLARLLSDHAANITDPKHDVAGVHRRGEHLYRVLLPESRVLSRRAAALTDLADTAAELVAAVASVNKPEAIESMLDMDLFDTIELCITYATAAAATAAAAERAVATVYGERIEAWEPPFKALQNEATALCMSAGVNVGEPELDGT